MGCRRIYRFEHEGGAVLGFDTGLDSRAFAQAKMAQFITGQGLIVRPDGTLAAWKPSGVAEHGGTGGPAAMVIWGPAFAGERLDLLINDKARRNEALAAVKHWIGARLLLGAEPPPVRPFAALVADNAAGGATGGDYPPGTVFFAPESLALRCMQAEGTEARIDGGERYAHPDRQGMEAAAFTAAAMLYRVLSGTPPFAAPTEELLREDMREGHFPPVRFAAPGLDEKLAGLIQSALGPAEKTGGAPQTGAALLGQFLEILKPVTDVAALFRPLSAEERCNLVQEKERFLKRKNIAVQTRRFVIRNTAIIAGCVLALLIAVLSARSIVKSRADRPTTAGMDSAQVIHRYYGAFGELDHPLMEACVTNGAGKSDIDMVMNLFVITRVRQAYEMRGAPPLISAPEWQAEGAGPVGSPVFGVTDVALERLSGSEGADAIRYRAAYTLYLPRQEAVTEETEPEGARYIDELTLIKDRGNWRIAEINRTAPVPQE